MANGHRHSCRPTCLLCRRLNWTERLFSFERMVWYWRSIWLVYAKLISASQLKCLFIIYYFVQIRTLFSRGAVLIFSWLQERSSAKNDVQTAVPSSCNERTSFRTMSVQFWNKNVAQAVRTILQRSNAQNGVRTAVLFNYFYRGFYLPRMYSSFCVIFLKWDNRKLVL